MDGVGDEDSSGGDAVLSLIEEDGAQTLSDGFVHVRVSEDNQRTLPSQFQRTFLYIAHGTAETKIKNKYRALRHRVMPKNASDIPNRS